jgi:hypothetical protein
MKFTWRYIKKQFAYCTLDYISLSCLDGLKPTLTKISDREIQVCVIASLENRYSEVFRKVNYVEVSSWISDWSFGFAGRNSNCGPPRVAANSRKHFTYWMGKRIRTHGAERFCRTASTAPPEPHRTNRGKFDGRHETFQERLRGLPWHAKHS